MTVEVQDTQFFVRHLQSSSDALLWAVDQVPSGRHHVLPLPVFGDTPIIRLVFDQLWHERSIFLPYLRWWAGGSEPEGLLEDVEHVWATSNHSMSEFLSSFQTERAESIQIVAGFTDDLWYTRRSTLWGDVSLKWVVTHTLQLTLDLTSHLMQMALYWDQLLEQLKAERLEEGRKKKNNW